MRRGLAALLLAPLLLAGCVPADGGPDSGPDDGSPSTDGTGSEGSSEETRDAAECLLGEWVEDVENLVEQWRSSSPAGSGLPVTGAEGRNTLTVTESALTYAVDHVVTMAPPVEGGLAMTGEAVVSGAATLDYEVLSPTLLSIGPVVEEDVVSLTRVLIDGSVSSETAVPWRGGLDGDAVWWCEGDTLSLEPASSGWIHLFARIG